MDISEEDFLNEVEELIVDYLNAGNKEAHLAELLKEHMRFQHDNVYRYMRLARSLQALYRIDEAILVIDEALGKFKGEDIWRLYSEMGILLKEWRSPKDSISWFDLSIENYVDSSKEIKLDTIYIFKGDAFAAIGLFKEALESCERSILEKSLTPKDEAWFEKGFVLRAMGKYSESIIAFNKALGIDPEYSLAKTALDGLSGINATLNKCKNLREANKLSDAQLTEVYQLIIEHCQQLGHWVHVIELMGEFLKWRSDNPNSWRIYGEALKNIGRNQEALQAFGQALEFGQDSKDNKTLVFYQLAEIHKDFSSRVTAEKWYQKAINESVKFYGSIWNARGINLLILGDSSMALDCFKKVIQSQSPNIQKEFSFFNQGMVYQSLREYENAASSFEKAIELNPENLEASNALKGIEGIEKTLELCEQMRAIPDL